MPMSRLIASIMLAILMVPLAAVVYVLAFVAMVIPRSGKHETLISAGAAAWVFITFYWLALWRKSVAWTPQRQMLTILSSIAAVLIGCAIIVSTRDLFARFDSGFAD